MASTQFDVILNGTKAKVIRGEGGYKRTTVRREIELQLLSQLEIPALTSRPDRPGMYQTSWAGGSMWWRPLLAADEVNSYFESRNFDTWTEPGKILPMNVQTNAANADLHDNCVISVGTGGTVYAIGATAVDDGTMKDVFLWTAGSDAFVQASGYSSGMVVADDPMAMVWDSSDLYHYLITDGDALVRFKPGTGEDKDWITSGFTISPGANIFLQNQELMFYSGTELFTVDKSGPSATSVFNDGMGIDALADITNPGAAGIAHVAQFKLAVSTPQGIYYVKNTRQGGQFQAWVFRVDKDAAGNWIGNPIATLPLGTMALNAIWHLGSLIITTSPDGDAVLNNDREGISRDYEVILYYVNSQDMGAIGSMQGGRASGAKSGDGEVNQSPFALLGTSGPYLYIAGQSQLWVYDAIRGGLHTVSTLSNMSSKGFWSAMAWHKDSTEHSIQMILGPDYIDTRRTTKHDDLDTVTDFGEGSVYVLTSNYFDGGLPMELKELTSVSIQVDPPNSPGQRWEVLIAPDDGAFVSRLTHSTNGEVFATAALSGVSGYRFQYQIKFESKGSTTGNRKALRAILVTFTTGEMITEWDLVLDGTEMLNIDNEIQDEAAFAASLRSIAGTETQITFVDNYLNQKQEVDSTTTEKVKVVAVEISKEKPGESQIHVRLREA